MGLISPSNKPNSIMLRAQLNPIQLSDHFLQKNEWHFWVINSINLFSCKQYEYVFSSASNEWLFDEPWSKSRPNNDSSSTLNGPNHKLTTRLSISYEPLVKDKDPRHLEFAITQAQINPHLNISLLKIEDWNVEYNWP